MQFGANRVLEQSMMRVVQHPLDPMQQTAVACGAGAASALVRDLPSCIPKACGWQCAKAATIGVDIYAKVQFKP